MREIAVVAHNLRSTHNVGSLLRTAEGLGVKKVILTGYTPFPEKANDPRLPHLAKKITAQIDKTALGAAYSQTWQQTSDIFSVINELKQQGYEVFGLEQAPNSQNITELHAPDKVALVLGREVEGIESAVLDVCDGVLEIPMFGQKESYNVVQAAAMALYQLRFH